MNSPPMLARSSNAPWGQLCVDHVLPPFSRASGAGVQRDGDLDVLAVAPHGQLDGVADLVLVQAPEQARHAFHWLAVDGGDDIAGNDMAIGVDPGAAQAGGRGRGSG